jgi:hypothetical protein
MGATSDQFAQELNDRIKAMSDVEVDNAIDRAKGVCERTGIPMNGIEFPAPSTDQTQPDQKR